MDGSGLDRSDNLKKFCGSGLDRIQFLQIRIGLGLNNFIVRSSLIHGQQWESLRLDSWRQTISMPC